MVALLLLVPCFWQPHIMAGDLSSHFYNAWLAGQIEQGKLKDEGLSLAHPLTNVLSDWVIEKLFYRVGRSATERIVVGAAVEIFFWGAFFFVATVVQQRCWIIAPSLGMLTYGLVFHLGFLNFYLSTGFSLWVLTLLWAPRSRAKLLAGPPHRGAGAPGACSPLGLGRRGATLCARSAAGARVPEMGHSF